MTSSIGLAPSGAGLEFPNSIVAGAVGIDSKHGAVALAPAQPRRAEERGAVQKQRAVGIYAVVGAGFAEALQDFEMRAVGLNRKKAYRRRICRRRSSCRTTSCRSAQACRGPESRRCSQSTHIGAPLPGASELMDRFVFILGDVERKNDPDIRAPADRRHAIERGAVGIENQLAMRIETVSRRRRSGGACRCRSRYRTRR